MLGTLAILAGISAAATVASGIMGMISKQKEYEARKKTYQRKLGDLSDNYELSKQILMDQYSSAMEQYGLEVSEGLRAKALATQTRSENALNTAMANTSATKLAYEQLGLQSQSASMALGQQMQRTAFTGFQNTGTAAKLNAQTEEQIQRQLSIANRQASLQASQQLLQAGQSYMSATDRIDSYSASLSKLQSQIKATGQNYSNQTKQQGMSYQMQKREYQMAIADSNYSALEFWGDTIGLAGKTASAAADVYSQWPKKE